MQIQKSNLQEPINYKFMMNADNGFLSEKNSNLESSTIVAG